MSQAERIAYTRRARPIRILILILLFTIALAAFIGFIATQEEALLQIETFDVTNPTALQTTQYTDLIQPDSTDVLQLIFAMLLTPPGASGRDSYVVRLALEDFAVFVYDTTGTDAPDSFCLEHLRMGSSTPNAETGVVAIIGADLLQDSDPICLSLEGPIDSNRDVDLYQRTTALTIRNRDIFSALYIELPANNSLRYFPYDPFQLDAVMQVGYSIRRGDEIVVQSNAAPTVSWTYDTNGERNWNVRVISETIPKITLGEMMTDNFDLIDAANFQRIHVDFQRPLLFRLSYPILILTVILIIGLLPFVRPVDELLEVAAALLFGIFGLRQVITLPNSQGQTLLDAIFLGLYVVLAFAIIVIVLARGIGRRREARG